MKSKLPVVILITLALVGGYLFGRKAGGAGGGDTDPASWFGGDDTALRRALADAEDRIRSLQAKLDELQDQLASRGNETTALRAERDKLTTEMEAMRKEVEELNKEWTFSYGSTRDAGKFMGSMLRDAVLLREMDPEDPERAIKARDMFLKFASMGPILQEMQKIDDKPKEFAEFRSSILAEALGLEENERGRIAGVVERYKTQFNNLPAEAPERAQLNEQALTEVTSGLNDDQKKLLGDISAAGMSGSGDLLETPSLDPAAWRARMQRNRPR